MLSDAEKTLYARQILLPELGAPGQERLSSTRVSFEGGADPRAAAVAREYLDRAGVGTRASGATAIEVPVPSAADVQRVAGEPALEECAAWLLGAFAAVEAIKACAGTRAPADFPSDFLLGAEVP